MRTKIRLLSGLFNLTEKNSVSMPELSDSELCKFVRHFKPFTF